MGNQGPVRSLILKQMAEVPQCCKVQYGKMEKIYGVGSKKTKQFDCPTCKLRWQQEEDGSWAKISIS